MLISLTGGAQITNFNSSDDIGYEPKKSICGTLSFQMPIVGMLQFSCDVAYREMGAKQNLVFTNITGGLIDEGILYSRTPYFRIQPAVVFGGDFFSFHVGPYAGYRLETNSNKSGLSTSLVDSINTFYEESTLRSDFGFFAQMRARYPATQSIHLVGQIEYSYGLMNVWKSNDPLIHQYQLRNVGMSLSIGAAFIMR